MKNKYYVLTCGENGFAAYEMTKDQVTSMLEESESEGGALIESITRNWPDDWESGETTIIIKGEIIIPTPTEKVTSWEIG